MDYTEKKFTVPVLEGISKESVDQHLGLYAGYVKNFNAISAAIEDLLKDPEKNALAIAELRRRHSFEFDGMKLHEQYFPQFEGGTQALGTESALAQAVTAHWGSIDEMMKRVRQTGMMRGPGWSLLYFNPRTKPSTWGSWVSSIRDISQRCRLSWRSTSGNTRIF